MKTHLSFFTLLGLVLFSYQAMALVPSELSAESIQRLLQYTINDQHDTLRLSLETQLTEINTHQAIKTYNRAHLKEIAEASKSGSIPEKIFLALNHQVELDKIDEQILRLRYESTLKKVNSLTALKAGHISEFNKESKESSFSQLKEFQAELEKANLVHKYTQERHEKVHRLAINGAASWVQDQELELEIEKSLHAVDGWKRKCEEQQKQYFMFLSN